jgi:hypothetical protein
MDEDARCPAENLRLRYRHASKVTVRKQSGNRPDIINATKTALLSTKIGQVIARSGVGGEKCGRS